VNRPNSYMVSAAVLGVASFTLSLATGSGIVQNLNSSSPYVYTYSMDKNWNNNKLESPLMYEINTSVRSNVLYQDRLVNECRKNRLSKMAYDLFGEMRSATKEENENLNKYLQSISKPTGVNIFDLC